MTFPSAVGRERLASYGVSVCAVVVSVALELGPFLLSALFSYMTMRFAASLLRGKIPGRAHRWLALGAFLVVAAVMGMTFFHAIRQTLTALPAIAATVVPKLIESAAGLQIDLPFESVHEVRVLAMAKITENALALTRASGLLTRGFLLILSGMVIAALYFMSERPRYYGGGFLGRFQREVAARSAGFVRSFERVLGAQVVISAVNTVLTAVFLWWCDMPYMTFLVAATFIVGIVPLVGNVVSNTLIVATALTLSLKLASLALAFLVFIHTLEHFLNGKIVGRSIDAPMWQTLLAILLGELVMGVPGILLAPTLLHYAREELRALEPSQPRSPAPSAGPDAAALV